MPDITIQAALTWQRFSPLGVQGLGTNELTAAASKGAAIVQTVGTTATALSLGGVPTGTNIFYIFVKNLSTTADITLEETGGSPFVFAKLKPGHFCILPVPAGTTVNVKASAASTDILVVATDTALT